MVWVISNHLNGQAVCNDPIDERQRGMVNPRVWGDGAPEGVRQRAAEEIELTARAAAKLGVLDEVGVRLDPVSFIRDFKDRIYHVDCKDAKKQVGNGRNGRLGSHLPWADPRRGWDFVSTGHGDVRPEL